MSNDTVDDLHAAEDMAGTFAALLEETLGHALGGEIQGRIVAAVGAWKDYCRPTCGAEGDPNDTDCEEGDTCGCPCSHADN